VSLEGREEGRNCCGLTPPSTSFSPVHANRVAIQFPPGLATTSIEAAKQQHTPWNRTETKKRSLVSFILKIFWKRFRPCDLYCSCCFFLTGCSDDAERNRNDTERLLLLLLLPFITPASLPLVVNRFSFFTCASFQQCRLVTETLRFKTSSPFLFKIDLNPPKKLNNAIRLTDLKKNTLLPWINRN
jgi:hypothetical protein